MSEPTARTGSELPEALRLAHTPASAPAARPAIITIALLFLGLAGLAGYELLTATKVLHRQTLAPGLAREADALHMWWWAPWAATGAVCLGVVLLVLALRPRRRTHFALAAPVQAGMGRAPNPSGSWLRPTDLARLCSAAAMAQPGVARARTDVTRRRAVVTAYSGGRDHASLEADIRAAVEPLLAALASPPSLSVRLSEVGS